MKQKRSRYFMYGVLCIVLLGGCKDIFEQDISGKQISINSPSDGTTSSIYKQLFWWNKLEGATQYRIQIATPSFNAVESILADTVIENEKFYKTLPPGTYQWRIRAENGGYQSAYQVYSLTMVKSALELQSVLLTEPSNNSYSKNNTTTLRWEYVPGATRYVVEIDTMNFAPPVVKKDTVSTNSYVFSIPKEANYKWKIQALNDSSKTPWSDVYTFVCDTARPVVPTLHTPANNEQVLSSTVAFGWNTVSDAVSYKLYLYRTSDTLAPFTVQTSTTNSKTYTIGSAEFGETIKWSVSAIDRAGNESNRSKPLRNILMP
jgi:hypothetical protein